MALFRRNATLEELITKLKNPATIDFHELDEMLAAATAHPEASPRKLGFLLAADNPKIREAGFAFLAKHTGQDCAEQIVDAVAAAPLQRRREMTQMLWRLDRAHVVEALRKLFAANSAARDTRGAVIEILGYGPASAVLDLMAAIKPALRRDGAVPLRRAAMRLMRKVGKDPTVNLMLREFVHDEDEQVRSDALLALCEAPTPDLVETLFSRLPHEKKEAQQVIIDALARLAKQCGEQMREPLFNVLADENPETRALAARLLTQLPDTTAVLRAFLEYNRGLAEWLRERAVDAMMTIADQLSDPLAKLMFDPSQDVRMASMLLAARWKHASIVPHVTQVYLRDPDWWTCSIAADILARFPSPATFATLMQRAQEPDLRFSVVFAMRAFPTAESTAYLMQCLRDPDRSVRCTALEGLRERPSAEVARACHALAERDPEIQVRQKAIETLATLGEAAKGMLASAEAKLAAIAQVDVGPLELEMENVALRPESS